MRLILSLMIALSFGQSASPAQDGSVQKVSPDQSTLDTLVGDWEVSAQFKGIFGTMVDRKWSCSTKMITDRKVLRQEYTGVMYEPYTLTQWLGHDEKKKKFVGMMKDSYESETDLNLGSVSAHGKTLEFTGETSRQLRRGIAEIRSRKIREVISCVDRDHYTVEWFLPGEDGEEKKTLTLKCSRKIQ